MMDKRYLGDAKNTSFSEATELLAATNANIDNLKQELASYQGQLDAATDADSQTAFRAQVSRVTGRINAAKDVKASLEDGIQQMTAYTAKTGKSAGVYIDAIANDTHLVNLYENAANPSLYEVPSLSTLPESTLPEDDQPATKSMLLPIAAAIAAYMVIK